MNIHADLIEQYAQDWKETDEPWLFWEFFSHDGVWRSLDAHPRWDKETRYRRKPRTFMVGDVEVRPVQQALKHGQTFYYPILSEADYYGESKWFEGGVYMDVCKLKRGLIHLNKEDAIAHGKALAALTGGE